MTAAPFRPWLCAVLLVLALAGLALAAAQPAAPGPQAWPGSSAI